MKDGKIRQLRAYYDAATMMRQLGLMPQPESVFSAGSMNSLTPTHSFRRSYAHRVILSRSEGSHALGYEILRCGSG
jgi:hypothetical protein